MPAGQPSEHEAKFQLSPEQLELLREPTFSLKGYTSQQVGVIAQTDIYMDTPAYDLLRRGLALRVRRSGDHYETGIKSIQSTQKGSVQKRMDLSIPLPPQTKPLNVKSWPDSVGEQFHGIDVKLSELRPIVVIHQNRQKAILSSETSERALAEWSLDDVWVETTFSDEQELPNGNEPVDVPATSHSHFQELEVELLGNNQVASPPKNANKAFADLVELVQETYQLTPIFKSKFVRGLESALSEAHEQLHALTPSMELEAAARLLLHQQLLQIHLNESGVRDGKKDKYVHEMRVAMRRALAATQLYQYTAAPEMIAPYEKGLKRLGRALGAVRDLDVALANLRTFAKGQPLGQQKSLKKLRSALKKGRKRELEKLVEMLDGKEYRKFVIDFTNFCTTTPPGDKVAATIHEVRPTQLRHTLPSILLDAFERVRAYETAFGVEELPPLETFHALRIQAKYLRYLLEFSQHLLGSEGGLLIEDLQTLQGHLGELNDARVEQERLVDWAEKADDDELCAAILSRKEQTAAAIKALSAATPADFEAFVSHPTRLKLATALAHI